MSVKLIQGDIVTANVDAIVNAANPVMLGGGGVDGAIHRAAGPALLQACLAVKAVDGIRCPTGEARITRAGNLPCRHVIHTVGPVYHSDSHPAAGLTSAYLNTLSLAVEFECASIAFPAISCGLYGYPPQEAARIAFHSCLHPHYRHLDIQFYLFDTDVFNAWSQISRQIPEIHHHEAPDDRPWG